MSVDNLVNMNSTGMGFAKPLNGEQDQFFNGVSNGYVHSSSSSHKHKSKDKHKDREHKSSKSSTRDKDKDADKHKSSSSSSKDKHRDKDKEKDKDKHRDRDKDKHKSSSSSHKSSTRDKDKEKSRDKDKDKDKEREKHRDKDKHREKSSKDHKDREKSDKSKDHHHKSSSSKDKHSSSSSKSKDKDKDRHSSSKSKDRHRDKDRKKDESRDIKDMVDCKENIKQESPQKFNYDQLPQQNSFSQFKSEGGVKFLNTTTDNYGNNYQIKHEPMNYSQNSSCDYSMSQFRDDEPAFAVKGEPYSDCQDPNDSQDMDYSQGNDDSGDADYNHQEDVKMEDDDEDEEDEPMPAKRKHKREDSDDDYEISTSPRKKAKIETKKKDKDKKSKKKSEDKAKKKKIKKEKIEQEQVQQQSQVSPTKGRKKTKTEEAEDVWKWWEEEKREDGVKWTYLEHKGPVFAPPYEPLPDNVRFYYDGRPVRLSQDAEEIACFYAKMLTHDYMTKKQFNDNFFKDWRKSMTSKERELIKDLSKCNFKEMNEYFTALSEKRKSMTKEEKQKIKEENEKQIQEYGYCIIDGHRQRIGNFKLEPPGLFRGRGEHPKMGLVKKRLMPEDILINCSKDSKIPQPPRGHKWKEVRHDNSVTWLASWTENIQGQVKYIMLNPSSKLKGEKDFQKYETARKLDKQIDSIRATYRDEWKSKEMRVRQRGVALYFIDKLALRAGNEKDEDQADTVGCCSLRVEHIKLHKELNGKEYVVVFDFLGKDSIRYYNEVEVEKRVFKNLQIFMENKKAGDDLFDRLNTMVLNEHLREIMEGLTAKVFRTYNASITLQKQLDLLTDANATVPEKLLAYNRANRAVAILCNHQRSIPKSHEKSMENLKEKIRVKREAIEDAESELHDLQKLARKGSVKEKLNVDKKKKQIDRLKDQLKKLELQQTDRDENKTIALGTSKLNYLDPRISVAWCKKHGVPIEKIFNKTQREKFRWAIDMADENYRF